ARRGARGRARRGAPVPRRGGGAEGWGVWGLGPAGEGGADGDRVGPGRVVVRLGLDRLRQPIDPEQGQVRDPARAGGPQLADARLRGGTDPDLDAPGPLARLGRLDDLDAPPRDDPAAGLPEVAAGQGPLGRRPG